MPARAEQAPHHKNLPDYLTAYHQIERLPYSWRELDANYWRVCNPIRVHARRLVFKAVLSASCQNKQPDLSRAENFYLRYAKAIASYSTWEVAMKKAQEAGHKKPELTKTAFLERGAREIFTRDVVVAEFYLSRSPEALSWLISEEAKELKTRRIIRRK